MNELVAIEKSNALAVFTTPELMEPLLKQIRAEIDGFTPDVSTATSRKLIASMAYRVAQSKTYLDGIGKELADAQKEIPKKIDASRKKVRDTLDSWRDEVRRPLTEWEVADEARIAKEKFNAAKRDNDLSTLEKVMKDKGELLYLNEYANKTSEVIKLFRDEQDSIKLSDNYTTAEKRLKIKELEREEEGFYKMFFDEYKKIDRSKLN